ncbi:MAG: squalene synthase HpnC [Acidiphilium sp.]
MSASVELASGKNRGDENFPVGSWLIRADLRAHVHAYYAFARNADDIADHPGLAADEKIARLDAMEAVLLGEAADAASPAAARLQASLAETGVTPLHAQELLIAFRQDAVKHRYASWDELMNYCRYSAAPVGRYVLALHGESEAAWPASDALCSSLQVLNHMQDCAKDFVALDRSYLPGDWLAREGIAAEAVLEEKTGPALRLVFDAMLAANADLNRQAWGLPRLVRARRLRIETGIIAGLAERLQARLEREDPLAARVKLLVLDVVGAVFGGGRYLP